MWAWPTNSTAVGPGQQLAHNGIESYHGVNLEFCTRFSINGEDTVHPLPTQQRANKAVLVLTYCTENVPAVHQPLVYQRLFVRWTQSTLNRRLLATLGDSWIGNPLYPGTSFTLGYKSCS
jgi:hypothetical protein